MTNRANVVRSASLQKSGAAALRVSVAGLLTAAFSFTGCHEGPPPNPPRPDLQRTAKGIEAAKKVFQALERQDAAALEAIKAEVHDSLGAALRRADSDSERDFGQLQATIYRAENGDAEGARRYLADLIQRSEAEPGHAGEAGTDSASK